jgi:hypothetical protein
VLRPARSYDHLDLHSHPDFTEGGTLLSSDGVSYSLPSFLYVGGLLIAGRCFPYQTHDRTQTRTLGRWTGRGVSGGLWRLMSCRDSGAVAFNQKESSLYVFLQQSVPLPLSPSPQESHPPPSPMGCSRSTRRYTTKYVVYYTLRYSHIEGNGYMDGRE